MSNDQGAIVETPPPISGYVEFLLREAVADLRAKGEHKQADCLEKQADNLTRRQASE
jgi:hypothetical protein